MMRKKVNYSITVPKTVLLIRTFMGKHAYQIELKAKPQPLVSLEIIYE